MCVNILVISALCAGKNHTNIPLIRLQWYLNAPSFRYQHLQANESLQTRCPKINLRIAQNTLEVRLEGCHKGLRRSVVTTHTVAHQAFIDLDY